VEQEGDVEVEDLADLAECKELLFIEADVVGTIFGAYEVKAWEMSVGDSSSVGMPTDRRSVSGT
jgi:hypothetical protein